MVACLYWSVEVHIRIERSGRVLGVPDDSIERIRFRDSQDRVAD